jgi:hypothetical protein
MRILRSAILAALALGTASVAGAGTDVVSGVIGIAANGFVTCSVVNVGPVPMDIQVNIQIPNVGPVGPPAICSAVGIDERCAIGYATQSGTDVFCRATVGSRKRARGTLFNTGSGATVELH